MEQRTAARPTKRIRAVDKGAGELKLVGSKRGSPADEEVAAMRRAPGSANGFRIAADKSDPKLQGVVSCSYSHGRLGESLMIGAEVTVTVMAVNGNQVRIGINAPKAVEVH
jgi:hypothetical protein